MGEQIPGIDVLLVKQAGLTSRTILGSQMTGGVKESGDKNHCLQF